MKWLGRYFLVKYNISTLREFKQKKAKECESQETVEGKEEDSILVTFCDDYHDKIIEYGYSRVDYV